MDNRKINNDPNANKSKAQIVWKHIGMIALATALAVITVFVLNLT